MDHTILGITDTILEVGVITHGLDLTIGDMVQDGMFHITMCVTLVLQVHAVTLPHRMHHLHIVVIRQVFTTVAPQVVLEEDMFQAILLQATTTSPVAVLPQVAVTVVEATLVVEAVEVAVTPAVVAEAVAPAVVTLAVEEGRKS